MEVRGGESAWLVIKNRDPGKHGITVEALGIDVTVSPGSKKAVELRDLPADTYKCICRLSWHEAFLIGTQGVAESARRVEAERGGARSSRP